MVAIFDSGLVSFAADESQCVEVFHNLGRCPQVIQFLGELGEEVGFPRLVDESGNELAKPYLVDTTDPNKIKVFKPNVYNYAGQFRIRIFD